MFEMYHGLKNKKIILKKGGRRLSKDKKRRLSKKGVSRRVSKNRNRQISRRKVSRKQRGGNAFPKDPVYMLSTAPHKQGERNLVAPNSMMLYERAFQGPFPSNGNVQFQLKRPYSTNNLLVQPSPLLGGKKSVKPKKKTVKKSKSIKKSKKVMKKSVGRKVVKRSMGRKVIKRSLNLGKRIIKKSMNLGRKALNKSMNVGKKIMKPMKMKKMKGG